MWWLVAACVGGFVLWRSVVSTALAKEDTSLESEAADLLRRFNWGGYVGVSLPEKSVAHEFRRMLGQDYFEWAWCDWNIELVPLEFQLEAERLLRSASWALDGSGLSGQDLSDVKSDVANLRRLLERRWTIEERDQCRVIAWGYMFGRAEELEAFQLMCPDEDQVSVLAHAAQWFDDDEQLARARHGLHPTTGSLGAAMLRFPMRDALVASWTSPRMLMPSRYRMSLGLMAKWARWETVSTTRARQLVDSLRTRLVAKETAEK